MDGQVKNWLDIIDAYRGMKSTEEQQEFASDFTKPLVSFSNPGTGKSATIITGLILAETRLGVPGNRINAMSFTTEATAELSSRYQKACKKCHISPRVKFNTFHSVCRSIILRAYPRAEIVEDRDYSMNGDLSTLKSYLADAGIEIEDPWRLKNIIKSIDSLNHALVYDECNVDLSYTFKMTKLPLDVFQKVRTCMFTESLIRQRFTRGDLPMYALYVLLQNPMIKEYYREQYKIMVVDEFQDMTKLYLVVLSLISDNLIVIGDMKQQIYGFNGACADIVEEYMKIYPTARRVDLTQSFRCANEIADFATNVYRPNDVSVKAFTGVGDGGSVNIVSTHDLNLKQIIKRVKDEEDKEDRSDKRDTMFLFRNNFSLIPVADELYRQGVPFRAKNFKRVMDIPIYNELCNLAYISAFPDNEDYLSHLIRLVPEFRKFTMSNCALIKVWRLECRKQRKRIPIWDIPYDFKDKASLEFMQAFRRANGLIMENARAAEVLQCFRNVYAKYIIEEQWTRLDMKPEYYDGLVSTITLSKDFLTMINEENDKAKRVLEANLAGDGVKCYTMHAAKGLEADDVYILDAESVYFPSYKNFTKRLKAECRYEAAKMIREERNLLYVGITRAKQNVYISYSEQLTSLIANPHNNEYVYLDEVYARTRHDFDDVTAFAKLLNMGDAIVEALKLKHQAQMQAANVMVAENAATQQLEDIGDISLI